MNRIIKGLGIALGCVLIASSCSEISFGDKFLGDQPESSGATTTGLNTKCGMNDV